MEARSFNHFCCRKGIRVTYSENISVALGIQHAMRMRHIVICGLQAVHFFLNLIITGTIFGRQVTEHKMCVLILSTNFV